MILKNYFLLFFLLINTTFCNNPISSKEGKGTNIRVSSYNIRVAAKADEESGNGWNIRKFPLSDLIKKYSFDIIGTQEGNFRQMDDLMELLPEYDYIGYPYAGADSKGHTASILFKRDKFKILDNGVFWYSETPDVESIGWDASDTRICTWAKITHKSSGMQFYFFTSHFYWRNVTARQNSGKLHIRKIQEIVKDKLPIISTGDFNSTSSTPQINDILTMLEDAYDLTETPHVGPTATAFPGGVFEGEPKSRIDYIFVNKKVRVLTYSVLNDDYNNGRYPSDHFPVVCDLFLKK